jgi:D-arginine dehydrogenase
MGNLMQRADVVIVGGGIAGMSLAAVLAPTVSVLLIEAEERPGFHATGRSVAFWTESYGGPGVQPLTTASGPLLREPMAMLGEKSFLSICGALHIGRAGDQGRAAALCDEFARSGVPLEVLERSALALSVPGIRPEWEIGVAEPSCADIDAAGLLAAFASAARRSGALLAMERRLVAAEQEGGGWRVSTHDGGTISCAVLVNAAGAWADRVATLCGVQPLGLRPFRRTVAQVRSAAVPKTLPLVIDLAGRFYFKRSGPDRVWLSPHDEIADEARDVAAEELDVALAVDRLQQVVDWPIDAVEHRWAGLRTFAPDRLPVYGFDAAAPGFFWSAGQGGFGLQTAPAAALLAGALLLGDTPPAPVAQIDASRYAPARFAISSAP